MVKRLVAIAIAAACQGQSSQAPAEHGAGSAARGSNSGTFGMHDGTLAADAGELEGSDEGSARIKSEEPETVDVGKAIADLGAISAWQAVVDRSLYLTRRGQHGVVFGTVGAPVMMLGPPPVPAADAGVAAKLDAGLVPSEYMWLVDDTEGNGALAIRIRPGMKAASVKQGDRVALGGAWMLDDAHRWYWKIDAVSPLPTAPAGDVKEVPVAPGHVIVNGELPQGARTISLAKDGDAAYFQLVGPPPGIDGDGWPVADELGNPVYALLNLPGERPSYGAQDLRAPDERWQLKRGQTYGVRLGHLHKHGPDKPLTINARTAPVRVM